MFYLTNFLYRIDSFLEWLCVVIWFSVKIKIFFSSKRKCRERVSSSESNKAWTHWHYCRIFCPRSQFGKGKSSWEILQYIFLLSNVLHSFFLALEFLLELDREDGWMRGGWREGQKREAQGYKKLKWISIIGKKQGCLCVLSHCFSTEGPQWSAKQISICLRS